MGAWNIIHITTTTGVITLPIQTVHCHKRESLKVATNLNQVSSIQNGPQMPTPPMPETKALGIIKGQWWLFCRPFMNFRLSQICFIKVVGKKWTKIFFPLLPRDLEDSGAQPCSPSGEIDHPGCSLASLPQYHSLD